MENTDSRQLCYLLLNDLQSSLYAPEVVSLLRSTRDIRHFLTVLRGTISLAYTKANAYDQMIAMQTVDQFCAEEISK